MKTTPWFDAGKYKPTRIGWYEYIGFLMQAAERVWWSGCQWEVPPNWHLLWVEGDQWRGLAKKP